MSYPRWWDTTITVYNRYEDPTTNIITWHRTVLNGCFIKNANNKVTVGQTQLETNNIIIRIPQSDNFKDYGEWINTPNDLMDNYFTLHQGDIIVKGDIDEVIDEYTEGKRSTDFLTKYKAVGVCLTISNWQDNTGVGRCSPHYYVNGE